MPTMPDILIWILEERLGDGSFVHYVEIPDELTALGAARIPALTDEDAREMAGKIADAINDHSNFVADTAA